jgi:hypothetical protein
MSRDNIYINKEMDITKVLSGEVAGVDEREISLIALKGLACTTKYLGIKKASCLITVAAQLPFCNGTFVSVLGF